MSTLLQRAVFEAQCEFMAGFKSFVSLQEDVDVDFFHELIDQYIENARASSKTPKEKTTKTRSKSAYSLFVQYVMKSQDIKSEVNGDGQQLMSKAVHMWKNLDIKIRDKMRELHKFNKTLDGETLFQKANDYFNTTN